MRLVVMLYIRFHLSLCRDEDLPRERGNAVNHETVRYWWNRFGRKRDADPLLPFLI